MIIKTEEDLFFLKYSSLLVGKTLGVVASLLRPGITTKVIDIIAEKYILDNKAIPAFKGYKGFPATLCISINDEVVHGVPGNYEIKEGDIVSVDCGVKYNGYCGDYAYTFSVGEVSNKVQNLINTTYEALYEGIKHAKSNRYTGDIGSAIQKHVEREGFSVVRELAGHGIGNNLHEYPVIPNYGKTGKGKLITENMVICIEPMINLGKRNVCKNNDGWTIKTKDKQPSVHFEHTVIVKNETPEILSTYEFIENNLKNNIWLNNPQLNKMVQYSNH